ncbi:Ras family protein, partial [Cooperia oncophora]
DAVIVRLYAKECYIDAVIVRLYAKECYIWDTAGQEQFRTLASSYYRGANGILIVYDITNENTFECVPYWLKNIERFACDNVIKLLVGNKSDLVSGRKVSHDDAKKFADENYLQFIETSAKSAENVEEAFLKIAREIKDLVAPAPYLASNHNSIRLGETEPVNDSTSDSWWYC